MVRSTLRLAALFASLTLLACGGGGSGGADGAGSDAPVDAPAPIPNAPTGAGEASRFLTQAAFGGTLSEIEALAQQGDYGAWIDAQRALPVTLMSQAVADIETRFNVEERTRAELDAAGVPYFVEENQEIVAVFDEYYLPRFAWWTMLFRAPDQLRQRVAYALSQILVVSDRREQMSDGHLMAAYYDILQRNALGSYRTLLEEITYNTAMGLYLTHMGNDKGNPAAGVFPDENYARELMQLFTIGLWMLNPDGTRRLDADGKPIPTYTNRDITELAKVMTGLGPNEGSVFSATEYEEHDVARPMAVWPQHHATGSKRLIDGTTTDGTTEQDIDAALDALVAHPNTAPFVSRFLIQRLVSANPTPAYVGRVAAVFTNNGNGQRGDLAAVVRAILLDREARAPSQQPERSGKLREPVLRYLHLLKAFDTRSASGLLLTPAARLQDKIDTPEIVQPVQLGQHPMSAPSVFNFYQSDHQPRDLVGTGLVSPESQIINATTVSAYNDLLRQALFEGQPMDSILEAEIYEDFPQAGLEQHTPAMRDFDRYVQLADQPRRLVEQLDVLLAGGALSAETENELVAILTDPLAAGLSAAERTRLAVYLVMLSPDYLHRP